MFQFEATKTSRTAETKQVFHFSYLVLTAGVSALWCQYHQSHFLACLHFTSNLERNSWGLWLAGFTSEAIVPSYITPQRTSASKQTQPKHRMCPTTINICPGFLNLWSGAKKVGQGCIPPGEPHMTTKPFVSLNWFPGWVSKFIFWFEKSSTIWCLHRPEIPATHQV